MTDLFATTGEATAMSYRVVIESSPIEAVTHPSMTRAASTTGSPLVTAYNAQRADGLKLEGVEFSIKTNPTTGKLDVGGLEILIVDCDNVWSRVFDLEPTAVTWLTADVSNTAATIPILTGVGFQSSGLKWIDGEAFYSNDSDDFGFYDCVRGVLSPDATAAQAHYLGDGARLRTPEITNWPVLWEGRRVVVYRYDEGDEPLGDGHVEYRGVVTSAPRFDGQIWRIGVDHMMAVLEQTFGEDLDQALQPRGIHYTTLNAFSLTWMQRTAGGSAIVSGGVQLTAQYETQEAFCTALTTALATSISDNSGSGTLTAVSEGPTGWHIEYKTAAVSQKECAIRINALGTGVGFFALDPPLGALQGPATAPGIYSPSPVSPGDYGWTQAADGRSYAAIFGNALAVDTTYYFYRPMATAATPATTAQGSVPRGAWSYEDDDTGRTIYLGGGTPVPSLTSAVLVKGTDAYSGQDYETLYQVTSVNTSARSIVISPFVAERHYFFGDAPPDVRLGLALQDAPAPSGCSIADVLDFVAANSATYQTLGILPGLRTEDYDSARWHEIFDTLPGINTQRLFVTFSSSSLLDIVVQELLAAACLLSLTNIGKLIPARLRLPAASEFSAIASIDETTLLTDKQRTTHEVAGVGQVNQVRFQTGYVASTGDFDGDKFSPRDVAAFGASSQSRPIEIAQRSKYVGYPPIDENMVLMCTASPIFGALSARYSIDTIDAAKSQAVEVGQPITFDNPYLLEGDGNDANGYPVGVLGVVGRVGLTLGKAWPAYSPRCRFTVLNTKQRIAGYAPSAIATSQVNTSGDTWDITVAATYFPTNADASDFFAYADRVQVLKFNSATASVLAGSVTGVVGNVVSVKFDSTWTPGVFTWMLGITSVLDALFGDDQERFCQVADAVNMIDIFGDHQAPARVFGS